jgi:hypothetical protein
LERGGAVTVYELGADPGELQPLTGRDDALAAERAAYEASVTPLLAHQGPPPKNAIVQSAEERARLEALGYLPKGPDVPAGPEGKNGPPGPPPGR